MPIYYRSFAITMLFNVPHKKVLFILSARKVKIYRMCYII